ncbi:MAG: hypothetical protein ABJZ69_17485, partial [Hyphomicrobiales bacterium]
RAREIIRAKPQNSAIRQFPPHENDNTAHACVFHSDALVIENMRKMRGEFIIRAQLEPKWKLQLLEICFLTETSWL